MMLFQHITSKLLLLLSLLCEMFGEVNLTQLLNVKTFLVSLSSRENLLKFPHLAAIQHNNCMYLAHHLLTLGHHFKAHLPQPHSEGIATFVDMVPGFRRLGK